MQSEPLLGPGESSHRRRRFALPLSVAFFAIFTVGGASTAVWLARLNEAELPRLVSGGSPFLAVAVCVGLTCTNLGLRWFRWHFLIRRYTRALTTRDSLAVYLSTLPALFTPFMIGELVRVLLLRRQSQVPSGYLVRIWFAERTLDAGVLLCFYIGSIHPERLLLLATLVLVGTPGFYLLVLPRSTGVWRSGLGFTVLATTVAAWSLPVVGLHAVLRLLSLQTPWMAAFQAFSVGTLFGGLTGLPLGVFVTGSTMISELVALGVPAKESIVGVLLFRAGTSWFAGCLGAAALWGFRHRLFALVRHTDGDHFDEIAADYEHEIPPHVRERLLGLKVGYIEEALSRSNVAGGAKGLDVGCGQGWYFMEMVRRGYIMDGLDYSQQQIERAGWSFKQCKLEHSRGTLVRGDATTLPYPDNTFAFAYSINALHHILSPDAQRRALSEIVRVLEPGGVFVLHEMNTHNPLFRFYMGYVFPILKKIDEGNEAWLLPSELPHVPGAQWETEKVFFTFLPDFIPVFLQRPLSALEKWLEQSSWRQFSAHYQACLVKDPQEKPYVDVQ